MALGEAGQYIGLAVLGLGLGAFGTLIGAGGGFILMPLLLLLYPKDSPEGLTSISLAVVFLNAASGSTAYARMRRIDYRAGLMFAGATIPGAVVGAIHTTLVSRARFDLIFSIVLLAASLAMLIRPDPERRPRPAGKLTRFEVTHTVVETNGTVRQFTFSPIFGVVLSFFVGYLSSFLGIGGGIIHVPALAWFLHFPVHIATATSHFILAVMALTGTIVHVALGSFGSEWGRAAALGVGVLAGAQVGAPLSNRVKITWIIRSLALALGVVGIRILLAALHIWE